MAFMQRPLQLMKTIASMRRSGTLLLRSIWSASTLTDSAPKSLSMKSPAPTPTAQSTEYRDAHYLSQLNTLSMLTATIATLERTDYLMRGRNESVQASILQALEIVRLELGIA